MNFPIIKLQNELVILKPLQADDFEEVFNAAADKNIWAMHPTPDRYIRESFQVYFNAAIEQVSSFKVVDSSNNQCIGSTRFYNYQPENDLVMLGYTFLAKSHWGGKYNKAMKHLLLNYAFQFVEELVLEIGKTNLISQKAAGNIGAKFKSETEMIVNGSPVPYFQYNVLKSEWKGLDF